MLRYLALGDSYTIGEQVDLQQNFPHQTVKILSTEYGLSVQPPEIIACTGWTTDELMGAIQEKNLQGTFDFVSLLIGVNNQYRNHSVENYEPEFKSLLETAIQFSGNHPEKVFVLSIPDWGRTPFAVDRDSQQITAAIDLYNAANRQITKDYGCHYLDITESTRSHGSLETYLAPDGLHYSEKEYAIWAAQLAPIIASAFQHNN